MAQVRSTLVVLPNAAIKRMMSILCEERISRSVEHRGMEVNGRIVCMWCQPMSRSMS